MEINGIAVLGSGAGACAVAAEAALAGYPVNIFDLPQFAISIEAIKKRGGIEKIGGRREGFAKINVATYDISEAIQGANLIVPVVPSYGHQLMARTLAPHLSEDRLVVLTPGSTGGALEFVKTLRENGYHGEANIAETNTLPYGARLVEPGKVRIFLDVKFLYFAAFPAKKTDDFYHVYKKLYPLVTSASNVLEVALNNGNPVSHPAAAILNAGRIEYTKGDYYHYREGITPSVIKVMESIDLERLLICKKMGFKEISTLERLYMSGYTDRNDNLYKAYVHSKVFAPMKAPENLLGRFITEDIPFGLVTWASLGDMIGVPTPVMKSIILIASILNSFDYSKEGRTVEKLGIGGMKVEELNNFLANGIL